MGICGWEPFATENQKPSTKEKLSFIPFLLDTRIKKHLAFGNRIQIFHQMDVRLFFANSFDHDGNKHTQPLGGGALKNVDFDGIFFSKSKKCFLGEKDMFSNILMKFGQFW